MANIYYDTGNNTPTGGSAPNTTLSAALAAVAAADDTIFAKSTSSETIGTTQTLTASATNAPNAKPQKVISTADWDTNPTSLNAGASIGVTAGITLSYAGNWHFNGMTLGITGGTSTVSAVAFGTNGGSCNNVFENCKFVNLSSGSAGASQGIFFGPATAGATNDAYKNLVNVGEFSFGNVNQSIKLSQGSHVLSGVTLAGSVAPTTLFKFLVGAPSDTTVIDSDLSGLAWTNLVDVSSDVNATLRIINTKIPAGINRTTGTFAPQITVEIINCDSANTHYNYEKYCAAGTILTDTGIYATTDPLADDGISISNKFTSSASCGRGATLSRSYLIPISDTATAITPFCEFLVSGDGAAALKTTDVYIEIDELLDSTSPKGTKASTYPGILDAGATDIASGTTAYTGDGYTTERTHRVEGASFTPAKKGHVRITVHLAKPSTTIYVGRVGVV